MSSVRLPREKIDSIVENVLNQFKSKYMIESTKSGVYHCIFGHLIPSIIEMYLDYDANVPFKIYYNKNSSELREKVIELEKLLGMELNKELLKVETAQRPFF